MKHTFSFLIAIVCSTASAMHHQSIARESSPTSQAEISELLNRFKEDCTVEPHTEIADIQATPMAGLKNTAGEQIYATYTKTQTTSAENVLLEKIQILRQQIDQGMVVPFRVRISNDKHTHLLSQNYLITKRLHVMFHDNSPHKDDMKNRIYHWIVTVATNDIPKLEAYEQAISKERLAHISDFDLRFGLK